MLNFKFGSLSLMNLLDRKTNTKKLKGALVGYLGKSQLHINFFLLDDFSLFNYIEINGFNV